MVPRRSHRSRAVAAGVTSRARTRTLPMVCTEITTARATATYRDRSASSTRTPAARALSRSRVTATMGRCARNSMRSTNAGASTAPRAHPTPGCPVIDPKRKSCRLPAYPGARAMIATPERKRAHEEHADDGVLLEPPVLRQQRHEHGGHDARERAAQHQGTAAHEGDRQARGRRSARPRRR